MFTFNQFSPFRFGLEINFFISIGRITITREVFNINFIFDINNILIKIMIASFINITRFSNIFLDRQTHLEFNLLVGLQNHVFKPQLVHLIHHFFLALVILILNFLLALNFLLNLLRLNEFLRFDFLRNRPNLVSKRGKNKTPIQSEGITILVIILASEGRIYILNLIQIPSVVIYILKLILELMIGKAIVRAISI